MPILLIHGLADDNIPPQQSERIDRNSRLSRWNGATFTTTVGALLDGTIHALRLRKEVQAALRRGDGGLKFICWEVW